MPTRKVRKHQYNARWSHGASSIANVSFSAVSDHHAKKQANRIARELNVTHTPRTIQKGAQVIECITTGVSDA